MPKLSAAASALLEDASSLSPESAGFPSAGRHRSGDFLTSFKDTETPVWFKDPDKFSPWTWRKQHNYFLDRGAKFMMVYKTPTIVSTDLFDLEKYGCFQVRGFQDTEGITSYISHVARSAVGMQKEHIKKWWIHPRIEFNSPVSRIGVRLQDLTTGELRWDAMYDLGKAAWKSREATEESTCPEDGWHLCEDEEPVGGEHPFFAPDWCPGPNDGMSHKYLLTVSNLSSRDSPEQPLVGEMLFTQYGVNQLDNTYSFEMHAPLSLTDQAYFTAAKGAREAAATARMTGRVGGPEGLATQVDRGKVPHEMDKLKELQKLEPPKDVTSAPEMAKSKLDKSPYSKMLDNKDFAKTLA